MPYYTVIINITAVFKAVYCHDQRPGSVPSNAIHNSKTPVIPDFTSRKVQGTKGKLIPKRHTKRNHRRHRLYAALDNLITSEHIQDLLPLEHSITQASHICIQLASVKYKPLQSSTYHVFHLPFLFSPAKKPLHYLRRSTDLLRNRAFTALHTPSFLFACRAALRMFAVPAAKSSKVNFGFQIPQRVNCMEANFVVSCIIPPNRMTRLCLPHRPHHYHLGFPR